MRVTASTLINSCVLGKAECKAEGKRTVRNAERRNGVKKIGQKKGPAVPVLGDSREESISFSWQEPFCQRRHRWLL